MTLDVRPVCMFCLTRFSLAAGALTACESWRAIDRQHVERRVATPEQHARLKIDREPEPVQTPPVLSKPAIPAPTPFDAAALRGSPSSPSVEEKKSEPPTGQTSLF